MAQLALQGLPEEGLDLLAFVDKALTIDPLFQAADVNHTHTTSTFAGTNEFIRLSSLTWRTLFLSTKTNPTTYLLLVLTTHHRTGNSRAKALTRRRIESLGNLIEFEGLVVVFFLWQYVGLRFIDLSEVGCRISGVSTRPIFHRELASQANICSIEIFTPSTFICPDVQFQIPCMISRESIILRHLERIVPRLPFLFIFITYFL